MRLTAALAGALAVLVACTSELDFSLSDKQCTAEGRCVRGYECDAETRLCVLSGTLREGSGSAPPVGSGGAGAGGAGALPNGDGGAPSDAGGMLVSNGGRLDAQGGTSDAGDGRDADGGDIDAGDAGGCEPVEVYRDADGDGFGDTTEPSHRCPEPGWATEAGDCRDDLPDVFPGQTQFFGEPYPDPSKPGDVSFDYDCAGGEVPDPQNDPATPAPADCTLILNCSGSGFLPATPARAGIGIEPRCGSVSLRTCVQPAGILTCAARDDDLAAARAFRCK